MSQDRLYNEEFWETIFDKSKATKLPDKFPGDSIPSELLQLEDVNEVVTDELDENAYSEIKKDISREKDAFTKKIKDRSSIKTTKVWECSCKTSKVTSIDFKKPNELSTEVPEEKQPKLNAREQIDDKVVSIDSNENESKPAENTDKDNSAQGDLEESLEGLHNSKYQHVMESETVAELQEIFFTEKTNIDLNNMIDSDVKGRDITVEEAKNLRFLLFGTVTSTFDDAWTKQNIRLNTDTHHSLRYHKGPTDGVMACIQAHFLKHLLFDDTTNGSCGQTSRVASYYRACLILAIVDILWQAGTNENATVCLPSAKKDLLYSIDLKPDGLIEKLQFFDFSSKEDLQNFIQRHFHFFEDDGRPGCVLLLYSLILSRSIERVSDDIEGPYECLITQGACSQGLLNLLIFGKATPNVFNMSREIKKENGKMEMHYGISKRSEVGFLSFGEVEDPKNAVVGSMLKTPVYPIWVAALKTNICVLFSKKRKLLSDWKLERRFDLSYFGGLPRNSGLAVADVQLTIDTVRPFDPDDYDYEFSSELEDTIRTKWQDCVIDWKGSRRF